MGTDEFDFSSRDQAHINLFRQSMRDTKVMHNMVLKSVPRKIYADFDTTTLKVVSDDFFYACGICRNADILYEARGKTNCQYYIYFLWDDRPLPDERFTLHFLSASTRIMEQFVERTKSVQWPLVIPILLHHSDFRQIKARPVDDSWAYYASAGNYGPI